MTTASRRWCIYDAESICEVPCIAMNFSELASDYLAHAFYCLVEEVFGVTLI